MRRVFVALLMMMAVAACATPMASETLRGREWALTWIEGFDTMPDSAPAFELGGDDRMSGNSGCNQLSGPYVLEGDRLTFGNLAMTKRACVDSPRNALESAFTRALAATTRYRLSGNELELFDESGKVIARFR